MIVQTNLLIDYIINIYNTYKTKRKMELNKTQALERLQAIESETKQLRAIIENSDVKKPIMERIKTFADVCSELGTSEIVFHDKCIKAELTKDEIAYRAQKMIAYVLNEGHEFKMDGSEKRYYPYFLVSSGFVFNYASYVGAYADAASASRLCFKNSELATYAGKTFTSFYKDFIMP